MNNVTLAAQVSSGLSGWYAMRVDTLDKCLLVAGCLFCLLIQDQTRPVLLAMMFQYLLMLQIYLKACLQQYCEFCLKMVSMQKFTEFDKIEGELQQQAKIHRWPRRGKVKFVAAEVRQRPDTPAVLKGIDFVVEPGTKISVAGASAEYLGLALSRMLELSEGQIVIDGEDISKVDIGQVRESITVLDKEPVLFQGTIRRNLDPLRIHSAAEMESLLIRMGLSDLLNRNADGTRDDQGADED